MIVACPSCKSKFKIDETRIKPPGVRLRCARCQTLFAVRKRVLEPGAGQGGDSPSGARAAGRRPAGAARILVAHESMSFLAGVQTQLEGLGYEVLTARDGVEAILRIQRELPAAAVLDAALPKMYGFEICEFLKRNASLSGIKVILVAADNGKARYKRSPSNLYGADDYIEILDIPHALPGMLANLLSPGSEAPSEPAPAPRPEAGPEVPSAARADAYDAGVDGRFPVERPVSPQAAPAPPGSGDPLDQEREKAKRLARIIVSDIALYNETIIAEGIRGGRILELLRDDLEEGYRLFRARVPASIAAEGDFVRDALEAFLEKKRARLGANGSPSDAPPEAAAGSGVDDEGF
jgi:predicted Zn finger-like uncharacterized protein